MNNLFEKCDSIPNISNWNTSKVTNMSYMFSECKNISDVFNVDNMSN